LAGIIAIGLFFLFYAWVKFSKLGLAIRATAQDAVVAQSFGVNPVRIRAFAFGLACAIAAMAGVILSPNFAVVPDSGSSITLTSIVIIVLGGMGSIRGCLIGGMSLALCESLGSTFISSVYAPIFGFGILIAVILLKPQGLYGNRI
jgi:branched-chain amino acid transport system permease protein